MKNIFILFLVLFSIGAVHAHSSKVTKKQRTTKSFTTESYIIADAEGVVLSERNSDVRRPIASISKLMVGLLASTQNLDEALSIPVSREYQSKIPRKQESLTRRELLTLALVKSDNLAAKVLCDNIPNCVAEMNSMAEHIGMVHTHYDEPTGLSKENVSTASDLLKLMLVASLNQTLVDLSSMPDAEIQTGKSTIKIKNTNPLTKTLDVFLSKTGFTNPAGGCIVMAVNSPLGQRFMILLGSRNAKTRIPAMQKLYREMR